MFKIYFRRVAMKLLAILALSIFQLEGSLGLTLTSTLNNSRPRLGEAVTFSCYIAGGSFDLVWWLNYQSEQILGFSLHHSRLMYCVTYTPMPRVKTTCDEKHISVHISHIQISDRGIYKCMITRPQLKVTTGLKLDVLVPPLTPTITNPSPVKVGENATLTCGNAENENVTKPVTYSWTKTGGTLHIPPEAIQRGALLFSSVKKGDAGKYVCVAQNDAGSKRSIEQDFVVHFPHKVQINISKTTVRENEFVRLECAASGGIPELVTRYQWLWKKSGFSTERVLRKQYGRFLEFARIPYDRFGTYSCKAWNLGGVGRASTDLNVQYSPRMDPEADMKYNVAGELGKAASFELFIIANPTPATTGYIWFKEDKILSNSSTIYEIHSSTTFSKLIIKNITSSDYTNYTCSVKTGEFEVKVFRFKLFMSGPPYAPTNLKVVNSTAVAVTLSWISEFNGGYEQRFYVQYKNFSAGNWPAWEVPKEGISDPGFKKVVYHRVIDLESNIWYQFRVHSKNSDFGTQRSNFSNIANERTPEKPQTSHIGVSRSDNKVTVRWKQVTGKYTAIKVNYCQIDTGDCMNYTVPNPWDSTAAFFVDANKTYYYYMIIEDGGDVVYRSKVIMKEVYQKTNVGVVGGLVGAVIVAIAGVILAVVLWKCGLMPPCSLGKSQRHIPAKDTAGNMDNDDMRVEFTSPRTSSVHAYDEVRTDNVNDVLHSASTASPIPEQSEMTGQHVPENGIIGNEPASSSDEDVDAYDYVNSPMTRHQSIPGPNPVPDCQVNRTEPVNASPSETMARRLGDEYTYNELRILSQGQPAQGTAEGGSRQVDEVQGLTPSRTTDDMAHGQESQYAHLEPVERAQYLDFRQLSPEEMRPI